MRNKWEKVKAKVKLVLMVDDDDDQAPSEQDIEDALKILVSRKPELLEDSEGYNRTFRSTSSGTVPQRISKSSILPSMFLSGVISFLLDTRRVACRV